VRYGPGENAQHIAGDLEQKVKELASA